MKGDLELGEQGMFSCDSDTISGELIKQIIMLFFQWPQRSLYETTNYVDIIIICMVI